MPERDEESCRAMDWVRDDFVLHYQPDGEHVSRQPHLVAGIRDGAIEVRTWCMGCTELPNQGIELNARQARDVAQALNVLAAFLERKR